jgi:hypothetical protein
LGTGQRRRVEDRKVSVKPPEKGGEKEDGLMTPEKEESPAMASRGHHAEPLLAIAGDLAKPSAEDSSIFGLDRGGCLCPPLWTVGRDRQI